MESHEGNGGGGKEGSLPPPPPMKAESESKAIDPVKNKTALVPMARRGPGTKGQKISLLTNHFRVNCSNTDGQFYQYSVALYYEDGRPVETSGIGRLVIDKVQGTYGNQLGGKEFAYDGEKSLFTIGPLPENKLQFTVVIEDAKSSRGGNGNGNHDQGPDESDRKRRRKFNAKTYRIEINFAARIPLQEIGNALRGQESENSQNALRVFDIILRQHAARQGCLLVRQSYFQNDPNNCTDIGGGILGCRGFHSSFRTSQTGLTLNIDVSTTIILTPGPIVNFLIKNQSVRDPYAVDWGKAKRQLKNLKIKTRPNNFAFKITGLSERTCKEQTFLLKQEGVNDDGVEVTVYDYFVKYRNIDLEYSGDFPCINVGKAKRPTYFPIELCDLMPLQRYTKTLTTFQRSALVEKSRQKPQERMTVLTEALRLNNYGADPMLRQCGIGINGSFTQLEGRVLAAPRLKVGNGEDLNPRNGRWNLNYKKLAQPAKITRWAVVNFSARCNIQNLIQSLIKVGEMKGVQISPPFDVFEENPQFRRAPPVVRVEKMFEDMQSKLPGAPEFLLCLLPERKNCDIYGPWKRKSLAEFGVANQCMAPTKINDQYLTNVLLKINAKLGGLNSLLAVEHQPSIPVVSKVPTLILGMDVSHGSPGQSDIPSIAAVVSSRQWPLISKYRACVRTQSAKLEMIDSLFKPVSESEDEGIMREILIDFYTSSGKRKPDNIIIFRDGVSESQFSQVLNVELQQISEACKFLDYNWNPKFVVIIAQKRHHTRFFQSGGGPENVPPGTIIDSKICHPRNYDFYLCAHAGMIGTTRPTHYHVLLDQVGFSPDDIQELVHSLSYVYQRSTTAISVVAPVSYAHLAASQMIQFMKFEDKSETSSSQGGGGSATGAAIPQLPKLEEKVCNSMFFC